MREPSITVTLAPAVRALPQRAASLESKMRKCQKTPADADPIENIFWNWQIYDFSRTLQLISTEPLPACAAHRGLSRQSSGRHSGQ